jgi:hypothetical protein
MHRKAYLLRTEIELHPLENKDRAPDGYIQGLMSQFASRRFGNKINIIGAGGERTLVIYSALQDKL